MAARHSVLLLAVAAAALAVGCGASARQASSGTDGAGAAPVASPSAATVSASSAAATGGGAVTTTARVDAAAGVIAVDVSVTGPANLLGGCQPTLTVDLVDARGVSLASPTPAGALHCLAITDVPVAAGQTREFVATIPLPAAHGTYTVAGRLAGAGPIPMVAISV